jgi:hypothetical protein
VTPGYGRAVRRARPSWRIPLAVALVALPLAGLSLLAERADGPLSAGRDAVLQPLTTPGSPAPAVRPSGSTTDPARVTASARAIGLVAVLLAAAGTAAVAAGGRPLPVPLAAGRPGRGAHLAGRSPPLLPR